MHSVTLRNKVWLFSEIVTSWWLSGGFCANISYRCDLPKCTFVIASGLTLFSALTARISEVK